MRRCLQGHTVFKNPYLMALSIVLIEYPVILATCATVKSMGLLLFKCLCNFFGFVGQFEFVSKHRASISLACFHVVTWAV